MDIVNESIFLIATFILWNMMIVRKDVDEKKRMG